ncbi:MAG TPA: helix-turn-helix domain-containing protein [Thermoanaerobaculia bacterium]|nr:helix-turn-helix domain-containing protein [Thermoanaerobaculia bacterium]
MAGTVPLDPISDLARAAAILHPVRLAILRHAVQPVSATELGRRLSLPRQQMNYHLRRLARAGFVKRAGRRRRRNMVEQRYVIGAHGFLLDPGLLGAVGADWRRIGDAGSPAYLLALGAQVQSDLLRLGPTAVVTAEGSAVLSFKSQFRFETEERREAFARALREAIVEVIARYTAAYGRPDGSPGRGAPFRLVLGCYPFVAEPAGPA